MAKEVFLEQEHSWYESPTIDVIQIATKDIVCASPEAGDSVTEGGTQTPGWGI